MEYLMSDHVMPGDACRALEDLATEGEHPAIVWEFATAHLNEMEQRFGLFRRNRLLSSIAAGFMDAPQADALIAFARSYLAPVALREFEDSADLIRFRAKLKVKTLPAIDEWSRSVTAIVCGPEVTSDAVNVPAPFVRVASPGSAANASELLKWTRSE